MHPTLLDYLHFFFRQVPIFLGGTAMFYTVYRFCAGRLLAEEEHVDHRAWWMLPVDPIGFRESLVLAVIMAFVVGSAGAAVFPRSAGFGEFARWFAQNFAVLMVYVGLVRVLCAVFRRTHWYVTAGAKVLGL